MRAEEIMSILDKFYGERVWQSRNGPLTELIQTVLAQHTSDLNALRSFGRLMEHFGSWEAIARAEITEIADVIREGGLARQKAPRIKGVLNMILEKRGDFDLTFLAAMTSEEALKWLMALPGVGPKTARCVLLFSLGMPVIPVDTHVHRVSRRLGLIGAKTTAEAAHGILEAMVEPKDAYRLHLHLIEHGRRICKAPRPRCPICPLAPGCPSSTVIVSGVPSSA